jgi:ribosomal-protein-alanine N-acetyltransferase
MRIECHVCALRPWELTDKASLVRYANNKNVSRNLEDVFPYPYTDADADQWLSRQPRDLWFAIEVAGEAVGGIGIDQGERNHRHTGALGYWLGEPFWGRGIMTAAVKDLTEVALRKADLYRISASVFGWNRASMRVLEKAGYQREAVLRCGGVKDGVVCDEVVYGVTRAPELPYVRAVP